MIESLKNWTQNPISYAPSGGTTEYLQALETYYHDLGFLFVNTKNTIGTIAGSEAINMALFAVCDPGDEILVFEPFYSSYQTSAQLWDIKLIPVEVEPRYTAEELKAIDAIVASEKANGKQFKPGKDFAGYLKKIK